MQAVLSHPNGLLGRLVINSADNSQALLAERGKGWGRAQGTIPKSRDQAGLRKALSRRTEPGGGGVGEHGLGGTAWGNLQGWGLACRAT